MARQFDTPEGKKVIYVKGKWPEEELPPGEPEWSYYEVKEDTDVVCRMVEVFVDGRATRNSIKLAEREGPDQRDPEYRSLVHGSFLEGPDVREWLIDISREQFERIWASAIDKPWPE